MYKNTQTFFKFLTNINIRLYDHLHTLFTMYIVLIVTFMVFRKALQAEYHSILYQYFPYVSDITTGPQGGIFVLVNPFSPDECHNMYFKENSAALSTRLYKLPKHYKAEMLH